MSALAEAVTRTLAEQSPDVLEDGTVVWFRLTTEVEDMRMVNLPLSPFDMEQEGDLVEDLRVTLSYRIVYPLVSAECEAHVTVATFTRGAGSDLSWREDTEVVAEVVERVVNALRSEHVVRPSVRRTLEMLLESDSALLTSV